MARCEHRVPHKAAAVAGLLAALAGCQGAPALQDDGPPLPLSRFLLTFDDGPSGRSPNNPTAQILDVLAHNSVQPGIRAIFFVQTRYRTGGATPLGRALIKRAHVEGHLLGLHSGSALGHVSHVQLGEALGQSLRDGIEDLRALSGETIWLVRPPYWAFTEHTIAEYARQRLQMLLTDVRARDGMSHGYTRSLRRRSHLRAELARVRAYIRAGLLPVVGGVVPVIVSFHDTNPYTAAHMEEYLRILVEEAAAVGLPLAERPFYADRKEIEAVVRQRTVHDGRKQPVYAFNFRPRPTAPAPPAP